MTPEEYERVKNAEKEHLKKLKELKQAVRVLERQKKIQSTLESMSRDSSDALETQEEMVERLALETAQQEARLDVALDSVDESSSRIPDEQLEEELQRERARALVARLKQSIGETDESETSEAATDTNRSTVSPPPSAKRTERSDAVRTKGGSENARSKGGGDSAREGRENPTSSRDVRPEKTIGRM